MTIFLLTRPSRDVTGVGAELSGSRPISTHTPLAGRDDGRDVQDIEAPNFYSHAPRGT